MTMPALTLQGLASWLETQDPETKFDYIDNRNCLVARYLRAQDVKFDIVTSINIHFDDGTKVRLPREIDDVSIGVYGNDYYGQTYGEALIRASAAIARMAP